VALARRNGIRLVTFDARIVRLADGRDVELLSAWGPEAPSSALT
jgi:hypothetical protein